MPGWNQHLFLLVNASAHPDPWLVGFAAVLANSPVVAGPVLLVALWVWGRADRRAALLAVVGAVFVGQGINQIVGLLYFEPRPFVIGLGHTLIRHAPDNSFPSDHATFVWTLGAALIATGAARRWGWVVCVYGLGVAWARVFVGVHYPVDMAASACVAAACAWAAPRVQPVIALRLLPLVERPYEATLTILHLPSTMVPRRTGVVEEPKALSGR